MASLELQLADERALFGGERPTDADQPGVRARATNAGKDAKQGVDAFARDGAAHVQHVGARTLSQQSGGLGVRGRFGNGVQLG